MDEETQHRQTLHELGWVSVIVGAVLCALTAVAWGQPTTLIVDQATAQLVWTWEQGTGGPVESWLIRCGPTVGKTTREVAVADPAARSIALAQVVPTGGTYVCEVMARRGGHLSVPSRAVVFRTSPRLRAPQLERLDVR